MANVEELVTEVVYWPPVTLIIRVKNHQFLWYWRSQRIGRNFIEQLKQRIKSPYFEKLHL